jgi:hypothetical protein
MRRTIALLLVPLVGGSPALAAPGVTTADVNLRAGPGTDFDALTVLPSGTAIDIGACDAEGWCAVTLLGTGGYISNRYLEEIAATATETETAAPAPTPAAADGTLTEAALDTLVGPVALYPDSLLAQVLVAVTVPLDVVKAGRWVAAHKDLAPDKREAAAKAEGWDESVATLAAGFPSVIDMLNADLDWTERLGDAVIADSNAVLDAVQRQRARAQAVGNLATNEAQVVTVVNDEITIAPANPEVVYVPTYNPSTVYVEPVPAAAPVYVESGYGYDTAAIVGAGAIGFLGGLALGSVFDNDWNDYWRGDNIDWGRGDFYPRPDIDIDRNYNFGDRNTVIGGGNTVIGGDRNVIGGDRDGIAGGGRPSQLPARGGGWKPTDRQRDAARQNIAKREGGGRVGSGAAGRPGTGAGGSRVESAALEGKLKASSGGRAPGKPSAGARPATRPAGGGGAFNGEGQSLTKSKKAAERGQSSKARSAGQRPASGQRPAAPQRASKPRAAAGAHRSGPPPSAFQRSAGGQRTMAASARGGRSMYAHGGGGRGGGGRGGGGRGGGRR